MAYLSATEKIVLDAILKRVSWMFGYREDAIVNSIADSLVTSGVLSADAAGRALMASDYFNAATVLAKFATDSIDNAQLLKAVKDGAFVADAATRALFANDFMPTAKLQRDAAIVTADATGRSMIAADAFDEATVLAKFATDSVDNAELLKIVKDGAFVADAATRALFASSFVDAGLIAAGAVTPAKTAALLRKFVGPGVAAAGPAICTGAAIGDLVVGCINLTDLTDGSTNFEAVITVGNQIQQTAAVDLSLKTHLFLLQRQS